MDFAVNPEEQGLFVTNRGRRHAVDAAGMRRTGVEDVGAEVVGRWFPNHVPRSAAGERCDTRPAAHQTMRVRNFIRSFGSVGCGSSSCAAEVCCEFLRNAL